MKATLASLLLALSLAGCATTTTATISHTRITDVGIYKVGNGPGATAAETSDGATTEITTDKFVKATTIIPARLHTTFGLAYQFYGCPDSATFPLTVRITHPLTKNPKTGVTSTVEEYTEVANLKNEISLTTFTFDDKAEIAAGRWTFQYLYRDHVLAEKSFTVVR